MGDPVDDLALVELAHRDPRAAINALVEAHGAAVHRYWVAMVGPQSAASVAPTVFGNLYDLATEERLQPPIGLLVHAVSHNRCLQYSRTPPGRAAIRAMDEAESTTIRALAQLKPIGRDALVLRFGLGLRWEQLERVCGAPALRMMDRVCRALRRVRHHFEAGGHAEQPAPLEPRVDGEPLGDEPAQWAAIREQLRRVAAIRQAIRATLTDGGAVDELREAVWRAREQAREQEEQRARDRQEAEAQQQAQLEREQARARHEQAEREAKAQVERAEAERAEADRRTEADRQARAEAQRRGFIRRAVFTGALLIAAGLLARWLFA